MILIKCKCGCHATMFDKIFSAQKKFKCPNCKASFDAGIGSNIEDLKTAVSNNDFKIYSIPDTTKITYKFDL